MSKSLLKASLLGGLVVFVWGMLSWMALPFHKHCFHQFSDESRVAAVIKENAPEKGTYILPYTFDYDENTSKEKARNTVDIMDNGPFVFASVLPYGMGRSMAAPLVTSLIIQIVGAFLIAWLLSQTKGLKFWQKVRFVTVYGLAVGILGLLPAWNWLGFSGTYVLVNMADLIISWWLAGLVIAKMLKIAR